MLVLYSFTNREKQANTSFCFRYIKTLAQKYDKTLIKISIEKLVSFNSYDFLIQLTQFQSMFFLKIERIAVIDDCIDNILDKDKKMLFGMLRKKHIFDSFWI